MLSSTLEKLITQLKVMGSDPLRYEMVASEVARRQVLMDNMKKQMTQVRANAAQQGEAAGADKSEPQQVLGQHRTLRIIQSHLVITKAKLFYSDKRMLSNFRMK